MKNNTLKEIANVIIQNESFALYPHTNMDGDTMGSCSALCMALRQMGKEAWIIIDESIPENLAFLDYGLTTEDASCAKNVDVSLCIDSGDIKRIGARGELFSSAKISICIDHHETSDYFCDYNFIEPESAATGQIIYLLLKELKINSEVRIANAIFAAITTDTGNFQYSNTQKITHEIVAELFDWGLKPNEVSINIYESDRLERLKIEALAMEKMRSEYGGKLLLTYVSQEMLSESGADMYETDRIVNLMRSIKGAEVSVLIKEYEKDTIKLSMRSKQYVDVAKICRTFGGGGHQRAAGATVYCSLSEAVSQVIEALSREL
ncbi:MAG: bifunctional oligoribonuclease/PAP phosphatase NrnA [Eubacterium sp.]|nr:bifunctional oligoribonuclease/PAP phosphatase NrnA [Eubacterium sp.]